MWLADPQNGAQRRRQARRRLAPVLDAAEHLPEHLPHNLPGHVPEHLHEWRGQLSRRFARHERRRGGMPRNDITPDPTSMTDFAARTPGAFVEVKSTSLAWHYRQAARGFGPARARELRVALSRELATHPVDILEGKKVVEVRRRGATKAAVVQHVLADDPLPEAILAVGDDRTDEEMFSALPGDAVTVRVGGGTSAARYRLRNTAEVRLLLTELLN